MKKCLVTAIFVVGLAVFAAGCGGQGDSANHHDLTVLSGPVFVAQLTELAYNSREFVGDTILIRGEYIVLHDDDDKTACQHFILNFDAAGCCPLMLRFRLSDTLCPEGFPEVLDVIKVFGEMRAHVVDGRTLYHYIAAESMEIVN